jgi:putative ABC transport system permease protein
VFTLVLAVLVGVLAGLAPAMAALRSNVGSLMRQGGRTIARAGRRLRTTLVVVEVALALILLVGAGLLVRSLGRLLAVDPGFDPTGLVTLELEPFGNRYDELAAINQFYQTVAERVGAIPGVRAVSATTQLPLSGDFDSWGVHMEAHPSANPAEDPAAFRFGVTPGFLETMRIPLLRGRDLAASDDATQPLVLLINQAMARKLFPSEEP